MKRKILVILVIFTLLFFFCNFHAKYKIVPEYLDYVKHNDMLSMMIEQTVGAGDYQMSTQRDWPKDGYIFNAELSKCENGGILLWDDINKRVIMKGNVSDKCYIYFDKYNLAVIDNIDTSATINSITVVIKATAGNNIISKYYFSINDGDWIENETNSYTFTNLSENTNYKIKVKCSDSLEKYSNEFVENINTLSYTLPTITSVSTTATSDSIKVTINGKNGAGKITKYYFSVDNGVTYIESTTSTYTFSSLSLGTYNIKVYVKDSNGRDSNIVSKSVVVKNPTLAEYIISKYTGVQGENGLYYHNYSLTNGASDNSYRYAGASSDVNNFICFSASSSCSDYYLYRIIGVFNNKVKIIKYLDESSDSWSENNSNTWSTSDLNIYLNGTYYNRLSNNLANVITTTTWKVGGNTYDNIGSSNAKKVYGYEITNPVTTNSTDGKTEYSAKIGLMYVSDYMYAVPQDKWTTSASKYGNLTSVNWMYLGDDEWTISRQADSTGYVYDIDTGNISRNVFVNCTLKIRPVFFLNQYVSYKSGTGTQSDPFLIN